MQLGTLERPVLDAALRAARERPSGQLPLAALEHHVDDAVARFRDERRLSARVRGLRARLRDELDHVMRTDETEHMDRPDVPADYKLSVITALDRLNRLHRSYGRFASALEPFLPGTGRGRVLELASGSGAFTFELDDAMRRRGLDVQVTGSDVVPEYIARASAEARRRGADVHFRVIDAFDMGGVRDGEFDVVFMAQAAHHFTPGQLARITASALRIAPAIVIIDGVRALWLLGYLSLVSVVWGMATHDPRLGADAVISARRFYSRAELELIARLAAPSAAVDVTPMPPGLTRLVVRR